MSAAPTERAVSRYTLPQMPHIQLLPGASTVAKAMMSWRTWPNDVFSRRHRDSHKMTVMDDVESAICRVDNRTVGQHNIDQGLRLSAYRAAIDPQGQSGLRCATFITE